MKKIISLVAVLLLLTALFTVSIHAEAADTATETAPAVCTCDTVPTTKYCPTCGGLTPEHDRYWDCTCGETDNFTAFCPACGEKHPNHDGCWDCPTCDTKDNFNATCLVCGSARPDSNAGKTTFSINVGTLKETLPIMGMGMLGIFLVIGTIALTVTILRKLPEKKEDED